MKTNLQTILPGKGLGSLLFGSSRDTVKIMLGKPDEEETYSLTDEDEESDRTEAWHYDELGISLSFDEIHNWKLSSIAVSNEDYLMDGHKLIGLGLQEVLELFAAQEWGDPEEDDAVSEEGPEHKLLHVPQSAISLWFDNDVLSELQWGPLWDEEELVWPETGN
jgi:hypothetical protein